MTDRLGKPVTQRQLRVGEMIKQALIRTNGRRKNAAKELGISERTLYRKIKQHNLGDVSEF